MAQLPPDGEWLVQMIGEQVVLFQRYTEEEIVRFPAGNAELAAISQKIIHDCDQLDPEQKSMAHFWSGYFYAHATMQALG
jgi:hypothetical protein